MSILARFSPSGLTAERYDASTKALEEAGVQWPPDGLEIHVCFGEEGNLRVSEIWDSPEQMQAFGEKLMPVLADLGIEAGEPEILPIHAMEGRGVTATQ